jgi:hypothetical protein
MGIFMLLAVVGIVVFLGAAALAGLLTLLYWQGRSDASDH